MIENSLYVEATADIDIPGGHKIKKGVKGMIIPIESDKGPNVIFTSNDIDININFLDLQGTVTYFFKEIE
jgi:hypothetical protein